MDYQIVINIAIGLITVFGGWIIKLMLAHIEEIKKDHNTLFTKHSNDVEKTRTEFTALALSLPEKYVSKDDFKHFAERINQRFDRLEEKIDDLKQV